VLGGGTHLKIAQHLLAKGIIRTNLHMGKWHLRTGNYDIPTLNSLCLGYSQTCTEELNLCLGKMDSALHSRLLHRQAAKSPMIQASLHTLGRHNRVLAHLLLKHHNADSLQPLPQSPDDSGAVLRLYVQLHPTYTWN
jgi:hypothetical protein